MRFRHIVGAVLACASVAAARPAASQPAPKLIPVQIGAAAASASYIAPYVAISKGYFRDAGLDVSVANFQGGAKAIEGLMGGSIDAVSGSYSYSILLAAKGRKIKAFVNFLRCPAFVVAVGKGKSATTMKDLKGMRLGITSPGSSTQQALNYLFVKAGLTTDDYTPVAIGNTAGAVAAVRYGKVDGLLLVDPIISILQDAGDIKLIEDMRTQQGSIAGFGGSYTEGSLLATDAWITAHPAVVQGLTDGIVRADRWIQSATPEEVTAALPAEIVGDDKALFARSITNMKTCFSPDGAFPADGAKQVMDILATSDPTLRAANINLADTYTNQFVQHAPAK
ncbi:ABC transporter substrate-binding protein [Acidisphaera sp. L21]|uniref:ABC transporter substrate-binding protein n=1 Tax=Acidisphaera sp. L21 TaxID=1641851 RepID=UPI00131E10B8|nr:ABC transporter substrate-binding protein [Acidisphaera sp. L21]